MKSQLFRLCAVLFAVLAANSTAIAIESEVTLAERVPFTWFDATAWTNGVPNAPGDTANVFAPAVTQRPALVNLSPPITLGSLNTSGQQPIRITGPAVVFDSGMASPATVSTRNLGPLDYAPSPLLTINSVVRVAPGGHLHVDAGARAPIVFGSVIESDNLITLNGEITLLRDSPKQLGRLVLENADLTVATVGGLGTPSSSTQVGSGSTIRFTGDTAYDVTLDGGTLDVTDGNYTGPISLTGDSFFRATPIGQITTRELSGTISGAGGLTINSPRVVAGSGRDMRTGEVRLRITGANTYEGVTVLQSGRITAETETAFGSAIGSTVIAGADVSITTQTAEHFTVESGVLTFASGNLPTQDSMRIGNGRLNVSSTSFPMQVEVANAGSGEVADLSVYSPSGARSWTGGSIGVGDLGLAGQIEVDAPLRHDGGLVLRDAVLNTANTYTGPTSLIGFSGIINHADALGTSDEAIRIESGTLLFNVVPSTPRSVVASGGRLDVTPEAGVFDGDIHLAGDSVASIGGGGTYNGPITYSSNERTRKQLIDGVFNGRIAGDGALWLVGDVQLNTANDLRGSAVVLDGVTEVNHPKAINSPNTRIEDGELRYNVPLVGQPVMAQRFSGNSTGGRVVLGADQTLASPWVVDAGDLNVRADIEVQELVLVGADDLARVTSEAGGSLRLLGELRSEGLSQIDATLVGTGVVRGQGYQTNMNGDLSRFAGRLVAEHGQLSIGPVSADSLTDQAKIEVKRDAALRANGNFTIAADIHFQGGRSATGHDLITGNFAETQNFTGDLHVGSDGVRNSGTMSLGGNIFGAKFTHNNGGFRITSKLSGLTDQLTARGGVTIDETGSIQGVKEILIGDSGTLHLPQSSNLDRIDDDTTVRTHGGQLSLVSGQQFQTSERIGRLHAERGSTQLVASSDHGSLPTGLTVGEIHRDRGAVVRFLQAGRETTTTVENAEMFDGNMLGAGYILDTDIAPPVFAALDAANQIVALEPTAFGFRNVAPTEHVQMSTDELLSADVTLASILTLRTTDLNGYTLRVRSGGVLGRGTIRGGNITAGDGAADEELIFHNGVNLEANVVDNDLGGRVALVLVEGGTLSGTNTYTGGTFLAGTGQHSSLDVVNVQTPDAVPAADRLRVHSMRYQFGGVFDRQVAYESVTVTGNGSFYAGDNTVQIDELVLEEGQFSGVLVGDGSIVKSGPERASIGDITSPDFTGELIVNEAFSMLPEMPLRT